MNETMRDDELIPVEDAARELGIPVKRLIGFIARDSLADPIGGDTPEGIMVYAWSMTALRERLGSIKSVVQP